MTALLERIAEVLRVHHIRMDYNHPAWGNCYCGFRTGFRDEDDFDDYWWEVHAAHVAEKVAELFTEETKQLADGMGGVTTNMKTGETTHHFRPCTRLRRFVSPWTAEETKP